MRRQEAWATLRHLVVEGSPQQAATMLSALLLGYADHGRDRAALLCEVAFAQLMADEADAALSTARLAMEESTHPRCADAIGPRAQAAATLALALAVRGPSAGTTAATVATALESASDLLLDLEADDPAAPMTTYLVAETALLSGRFVAAEEAAARGRAVSRGSSASNPRDPIALILNELVLARSLVLRGRRKDGAVLASQAADRASRMSMSALGGGRPRPGGGHRRRRRRPQRRARGRPARPPRRDPDRQEPARHRDLVAARLRRVPAGPPRGGDHHRGHDLRRRRPAPAAVDDAPGHLRAVGHRRRGPGAARRGLGVAGAHREDRVGAPPRSAHLGGQRAGASRRRAGDPRSGPRRPPRWTWPRRSAAGTP